MCKHAPTISEIYESFFKNYDEIFPLWFDFLECFPIKKGAWKGTTGRGEPSCCATSNCFGAVESVEATWSESKFIFLQTTVPSSNHEWLQTTWTYTSHCVELKLVDITSSIVAQSNTRVTREEFWPWKAKRENKVGWMVVGLLMLKCCPHHQWFSVHRPPYCT